MKQCTICGEVKEFAEYSKNKTKGDGLQSHCKSCSKAKFKAYYEANKDKQRSVIMAKTEVRRFAARDFVIEFLKNNPCVDCGNSDIRVLEFDHKLGSDKKNGVARLAAYGYTIPVIKAEIEKCEVRCKNCHTIKTYERYGGSWHDKYMPL